MPDQLLRRQSKSRAPFHQLRPNSVTKNLPKVERKIKIITSIKFWSFVAESLKGTGSVGGRFFAYLVTSFYVVYSYVIYKNFTGSDLKPKMYLVTVCWQLLLMDLHALIYVDCMEIIQYLYAMKVLRFSLISVGYGVLIWHSCT